MSMAHGGARRGAGRKRGGTNGTADRRRRIKAAATARAIAKLTVTKEAVLGELAKLGFANMADYMKVGPDGLPVLDFSGLTRDQAAAIHELVVETRTEERDDGPPIVIVKTRFKLADKRGPLVDLGKHLGLFKDRVEHSGRDGGPIEAKHYTDIEVARLIGRLLTRVAGASPLQAGEAGDVADARPPETGGGST
jgi:phage terminase small subunit